jgi:hypothetical protein
MRDVMHDIRVVPAIAPVVVVDNTATVSSIIDMQGAQSCAFYVITGALVDAAATFAVLLQEGNHTHNNTQQRPTCPTQRPWPVPICRLGYPGLRH